MGSSCDGRVARRLRPLSCQSVLKLDSFWNSFELRFVGWPLELKFQRFATLALPHLQRLAKILGTLVYVF